MSPGAKGLIGEATGWVLGLGIAAMAFIYQDALKGVVGDLLGLPGAEQVAAAQISGSSPGQGERPQSGTVEIRAGAHGHFHATAEINGRPVEVMVDTGASIVAMSYEDAERAGIYVRDSDFTGRVSTANGVSRVAPVVLDRVSIGDITVRNVRAAIAEPGRLGTTLLGMSFLGRLQRADMRSGVLVLQE